MTTAAKIAVNMKNAAMSTGPKNARARGSMPSSMDCRHRRKMYARRSTTLERICTVKFNSLILTLAGIWHRVFHFRRITFCVIGKALFGNREFQTAKAKPGTRQLARLGVFFAMALRGATNRGATGSRLLPFRSAGKVKMKRLVLTLALAMTFSAFAQDKPEDFRIVNGQIYNIHESGKWEDLAYGHNFDDYYAVLVVRKIGKHGTLDCDREFYDRKRGGGISLSSTTELILKNYPHAEDANIGMKISKCRAMRLRNNPWDTVNTYDYGLPNTPENRNHTRTAWVYGIVMMLVLMGFAGWWICRTKTKS